MIVAGRSGLLAPLAGARVAVVGFGRSGVAAARLLTSLPAPPKEVRVSDARARDDLSGEARRAAEALAKAGVAFAFGGHASVVSSDLVVLSPGVPVETVRAAGYDGAIWSEIELAFRALVEGGLAVRPLAVTGTNGKTTTATLLARILERAFPRRTTHLAGNVGTAACGIVSSVAPEDLVVLEVSSFQLETTEAFRPSVAVLLNVAPDHLDRYDDFEAYRAAKARLFARMGEGDTAIVNVEDAGAAAVWETIPAGVRREALRVETLRVETLCEADAAACPRPRAPVPPINVLAALRAAEVLGASPCASAEAVRDFEGLPHRLQFAGEVNGVAFYNDSKATNFHAVAYALRTVPKPVCLILGGRSKGEDPAVLAEHLEGVERVVAFGEMRRSVANAIGPLRPVTVTETVDEAVDAALDEATNVRSVLFSPGGSSFDAFSDYAARGEAFLAAVRRRTEGAG